MFLAENKISDVDDCFKAPIWTRETTSPLPSCREAEPDLSIFRNTFSTVDRSLRFDGHSATIFLQNNAFRV